MKSNFKKIMALLLVLTTHQAPCTWRSRIYTTLKKQKYAQLAAGCLTVYQTKILLNDIRKRAEALEKNRRIDQQDRAFLFKKTAQIYLLQTGKSIIPTAQLIGRYCNQLSVPQLLALILKKNQVQYMLIAPVCLAAFALGLFKKKIELDGTQKTINEMKKFVKISTIITEKLFKEPKITTPKKKKK